MRRIAMIVSAVVLAVVPAGAAQAAAGGYGPTATGPDGVPGGYTTVTAAKVIGTSGGELSTSVGAVSVKISVPAGAFSSSEQVVITTPVLTDVNASLPELGLSKFRAISGLGIKVLDSSGAPLQGSFAAPATVTLSGAGLGDPGQEVAEFTAKNAVTIIPATLGTGTVTFSITQDPALVVLAPLVAPVKAGSSGTSAHTGKPLNGEFAIGLLLLGAAAAMVARRRRLTPTR